MHALLVGAAGVTGKDVLELLLNDPYFEKVDVFVRRQMPYQHEKLTLHNVEFGWRESWEHLVKGDVLFSCLGTTLKAAGGKSEKWKIDYDFQYEFAIAAKENGVPCYVLVSAGFACPDAPLFYPSVKGRLEYAIKSLGFPKMAIFNPPLLVRGGNDRKEELIRKKLIRWLDEIGLIRSKKPLPTKVLAQAMINAAKTESSGIISFEGKQIWELAQC